MGRSINRCLIGAASSIGILSASNIMAADLPGAALAQQWCAACHAVKPGQVSPNPKAPAFTAIAAEPSATEYSLSVFLKTTHATMPNYKIDPDDIDALVDYIRSLKR